MICCSNPLEPGGLKLSQQQTLNIIVLLYDQLNFVLCVPTYNISVIPFCSNRSAI